MKHELEPVLIFQCEEAAEILVVQFKLGQRNIRIFNAYGPQEVDVSAQTKLNFLQMQKYDQLLFPMTLIVSQKMVG